MENLIQLFLWLQVSACLDKGKAATCGQESEGVSVEVTPGRQSPTGLEPRQVEAMQLQKCPFELHALETTHGVRDGKPSPPVCGNTHQPHASTGSSKI